MTASRAARDAVPGPCRFFSSKAFDVLGVPPCFDDQSIGPAHLSRWQGRVCRKSEGMSGGTAWVTVKQGKGLGARG